MYDAEEQLLIEVRNLKKICTSHPSQWEGQMDTGETVSIRYRHGELLTWIYASTEHQLTLFWGIVGDKHGFEMDTEEMKTHLASVCRFIED